MVVKRDRGADTLKDKGPDEEYLVLVASCLRESGRVVTNWWAFIDMTCD